MCWLQQSAQLWAFPTFLLVPLMLIGAIECFAGYRAWRFLLGLNGAVFGFVAGATLCVMLGMPMLILIGAFAGGVAGAMLLAGCLPLGSFIFAFASVASLTILMAHIIDAPPHWFLPLACAAGLGGAVAAVAGCRRFMIAIAAIAGAQQIASAWRAHSLPHGALPLPDIITAAEAAAFIALAAAGLLLQLATTRLRSHPSDAAAHRAKPPSPDSCASSPPAPSAGRISAPGTAAPVPSPPPAPPQPAATLQFHLDR